MVAYTYFKAEVKAHKVNSSIFTSNTYNSGLHCVKLADNIYGA